jgi:bacillopeptidase F
MQKRFIRSEERKNLQKSILYLAAAAVIGILFLYVGVPALARLAVFIGNSSSSGNSSQSDTFPPAPPRLAPVDEFTKNELVSIKGFTESGVDVELFLNGNSVKSLLADSSGEFLFTDVNLEEGANEIYVISTDTNGNESQGSGLLKITLDKEPPTLTIETPKDNETISGQDKKNIKIKGQAEEGISVSVNNRTAILDVDGKFEADFTLADGSQEIKIVATDKAGNTTEKILNITFNP